MAQEKLGDQQRLNSREEVKGWQVGDSVESEQDLLRSGGRQILDVSRMLSDRQASPRQRAGGRKSSVAHLSDRVDEHESEFMIFWQSLA